MKQKYDTYIIIVHAIAIAVYSGKFFLQYAHRFV